MRTKFTYIVCLLRPDHLEEAEDTKLCGSHLYDKYSLKNENCFLINVMLKSDKTLVSYKRGDDVFDHDIIKDKGEIEFSGDVGMYIVGNFTRLDDAIELWKPEALASMLKATGFMEIRKICLVACNTAKVDAQKSNEKSYLERFVEALRDNGLRPKVAGWDSYVEIAGLGFETSRHQDFDKKNRKISFSDEDMRNHQGGKIVGETSRRNVIAKQSPNINSQHKIVFYINEHNVLTKLELSKWTDRV